MDTNVSLTDIHFHPFLSFFQYNSITYAFPVTFLPNTDFNFLLGGESFLCQAELAYHVLCVTDSTLFSRGGGHVHFFPVQPYFLKPGAGTTKDPSLAHDREVLSSRLYSFSLVQPSQTPLKPSIRSCEDRNHSHGLALTLSHRSEHSSRTSMNISESNCSLPVSKNEC